MAADDAVVVGLAAALPVYNLVANRWAPFNRGLYVPMNLMVAAIVVALALGPAGLTAEAIVGSSSPSGGAFGFLLAVLAVIPLFVLSLFERGARLVCDERVAHLRGLRLTYQVLVRIPLGTALLEEVTFRGVLFAAWRDQGAVRAALASSFVFGLWHVGPTINLVQANRPNASTAATIKTIVGAVVFTTAAGIVFSWLRIEHGLVAPLVMHATVNALATIASVVAARGLSSHATSAR